MCERVRAHAKASRVDGGGGASCVGPYRSSILCRALDEWSSACTCVRALTHYGAHMHVHTVTMPDWCYVHVMHAALLFMQPSFVVVPVA